MNIHALVILLITLILTIPFVVISCILTAKSKYISKSFLVTTVGVPALFGLIAIIISSIALATDKAVHIYEFHFVTFASLAIGGFSFLTSIGGLALTISLYRNIKKRYQAAIKGSSLNVEKTTGTKRNPVIIDKGEPNLDDIRKLRELLESGTITQEEFDKLLKRLTEK